MKHSPINRLRHRSFPCKLLHIHQPASAVHTPRSVRMLKRSISSISSEQDFATQSKANRISASSSSAALAFDSSTMSSSSIGNNSVAPKKLTIKPFKVKPQTPSSFESETMARLKQAVDAVFAQRSIASSMEDLYRSVENLCLHKRSAEVYEQLYLWCNEHVAILMTGLHESFTRMELAQFLEAVNDMWNQFCEQLRSIRSMFLYLDRTFVINKPEIRSLLQMGLTLFRDHFQRDHSSSSSSSSCTSSSDQNDDMQSSSSSSPPSSSAFSITHLDSIQHRVVQGLLLLLQRERQGEVVSSLLIRSLCRMLMSLHIYQSSFEVPALLPASQSFYRSEGQRLIQEMEPVEYFRHVVTRIKQEAERVHKYFDESSTRRPLLAEVQQQLFHAHADSILDKAFPKMADGKLIEELTSLYLLCSRVGVLTSLRSSWLQYIKKSGLLIVQDESKDKEMIDLLLAFHQRLSEIQQQSFRSDSTFQHALNEACESFLNERKNRPAELIAKFIDEKLKAAKGSGELELDELLNRVLAIFRFLQGKDVFEAYYKTHLAKRLLLNKSASLDLERMMVAKLHKECGAAFTSKLEGMFKDMDMSKEFSQSYQSYLANKASSSSSSSSSPAEDVDFFEAQVLTLGVWPSYPDPVDLPIPAEVVRAQESFKEYYLSKHTGRRLVWQHSLAHCILKANYGAWKHELILSAFQASVLLLYNETDQLTMERIRRMTNLSDKDLIPTLVSLACGKVRVLRKEPDAKEILDTDVFHYIPDFRQKLYRLKINQVQLKESKEEKDSTDERIMQDRQYQIDAAVVRIMKARKTLRHSELITETLGQLKFPALIADLKKRIESLIEREYLERDKENAQIFHYLA